MKPVPEAKKLRQECKEFCPKDCPANMFTLMEQNCKRSCRLGYFNFKALSTAVAKNKKLKKYLLSSVR